MNHEQENRRCPRRQRPRRVPFNEGETVTLQLVIRFRMDGPLIFIWAFDIIQVMGKNRDSVLARLPERFSDPLWDVSHSVQVLKPDTKQDGN